MTQGNEKSNSWLHQPCRSTTLHREAAGGSTTKEQSSSNNASVFRSAGGKCLTFDLLGYTYYCFMPSSGLNTAGNSTFVEKNGQWCS
jgi:hypothetical protein